MAIVAINQPGRVKCNRCGAGWNVAFAPSKCACESATWETLSEPARGYLRAALWTMTDGEGRALDHLGLDDVDPAELAATAKRVGDWCVQNAAAIGASGLDGPTVGHELFLTAGGHGSGFWDRHGETDAEREAIAALDRAARAFPDRSAYVGDNGKVYLG